MYCFLVHFENCTATYIMAKHWRHAVEKAIDLSDKGGYRDLQESKKPEDNIVSIKIMGDGEECTA